jgi:hypothetical protein
MTGSIPPNLIMSLIFGVGQVGVGSWLVWYELAPRAWRRPSHWRDWRAILAGAAGVWFIVSGVCELIVSGMETSRLRGGGPSLAAYDVTKTAADGVLFAVTAALAVALAVYVGAWFSLARRTARSVQASETSESERSQ